MIKEEKIEMLDCQDKLQFSKTHSKKRMEKAKRNFGMTVIQKVISFALYLLGANRNTIAEITGIPLGTLLSFLTRADLYGLSAFDDQRKKSASKAQKIERPSKLSVSILDQNISIQLGREDQRLTIPLNNTLQYKVVLLSFFNSGLLSVQEISSVLGFSERHIRDLNKKLHNEDVYSLIDKRKGQQIEYRFPSDIKAELVQQFVAHTLTDNPTSSHVLSECIRKRCNVQLAPRSIRFHIRRLGLYRIVKSLPVLVDDLKKTPCNDLGNG